MPFADFVLRMRCMLHRTQHAGWQISERTSGELSYLGGPDLPEAHTLG
jgi:hypothetical protein